MIEQTMSEAAAGLLRHAVSPTKKRRTEKLINIAKELKDNIVIVEGKNDVRALKSLGLTDIIPINGKPLIETVHKIIGLKGYTQGVVILTDFDSQGQKIAAKLEFLLRKYGVHPNSRIRCCFMDLGWNKIEDLNSLQKQGLKEVDVYVETGTHIDKIRNKSKDKGKRGYREARHNRGCVWPDRRSSGT